MIGRAGVLTLGETFRSAYPGFPGWRFPVHLIDKRKLLMDSRGHYSRPELLSLLIDRSRTAHVHECATHPIPDAEQGPKYLEAKVEGLLKTTSR